MVVNRAIMVRLVVCVVVVATGILCHDAEVMGTAEKRGRDADIDLVPEL